MTINRAERLRADLVLLLVALIWGSAFAAQRAAAQLGAVFIFNGLRFWIAALVLLPFATWRGINFRELITWSGLTGVVLFLGSALQQAGMQYTSAGNAGFLTSLYVVIVPFVIFIVWREKPHWLAAVAVIFSAAGAYLLSTGGEFHFQYGDALEVISALFWAGHVILIGKVGGKFNVYAFTIGQCLIGGLINLIAGSITESISYAGLLDIAPYMIYTGIFSIGIGYALQTWGQRRSPPSDAALILGLESVFAAFFGWWLLSESLTLIQLAGCALILFAVFMSQARVLSLHS
jgi:drug/metabolite transporter (DMT)-like permease